MSSVPRISPPESEPATEIGAPEIVPPLVYASSQEGATGAHLSTQTKWSSLSIKEPLRASRPPQDVTVTPHTQRQASLPVWGWIQTRTRLPLPPLSHRTVIPSGLLHKHVPYKSHEPLPLSPNYCSVSKNEKAEKGM